tara:strand:- start:236 stop:1099 length:864 start_codon:yes stop_codon:yes gene_type:complete
MNYTYVPNQMMRNENLKKYHNIHKGKRCWIIGNGPSLNKTNLNLIKDELSFGMNRIALLYPKTEWRPSHYVYCSTNVDDHRWGDGWVSSVRESVSKDNCISFVADKFKNTIERNGVLTNPNLEWFSSLSENGVGRPNSFSTDSSFIIDKSGTTMNVALQLAYYMGFSKIFIVGADISWQSSDSSNGDPNHFDPTYRASIANGEWERAHMRATHIYAYEQFKKVGVEVYNATVETFLDVYPLVDFEEVANDKNWSGNNKDSDNTVIKEKRQMITDYWKTNEYERLRSD